MFSDVTQFSTMVAATDEDFRDVFGLRQRVYVEKEGRLSDIASMKDTFDRYDPVAEYLLTRNGRAAVGTVKVIRDSAHGLPCEAITDIADLRSTARVVELGHFITAPSQRSSALVLAMVRSAVQHAVEILGARFL